MVKVLGLKSKGKVVVVVVVSCERRRRSEGGDGAFGDD